MIKLRTAAIVAAIIVAGVSGCNRNQAAEPVTDDLDTLLGTGTETSSNGVVPAIPVIEQNIQGSIEAPLAPPTALAPPTVIAQPINQPTVITAPPQLIQEPAAGQITIDCNEVPQSKGQIVLFRQNCL